MSEETQAVDAHLVRTSQVVAAFVANHAISAGDLPGLIGSVHAALGGLGHTVVGPTAALVPAVPIKKSVTPDFIVCLDDGKKFKSMKRHLAGLGMTPDEYRTRWGLPPDYPMVAPNYTATRSALAISSGLGRKPVPVAATRKPERNTAKTR
jgi:predicted transcriptional regulator